MFLHVSVILSVGGGMVSLPVRSQREYGLRRYGKPYHPVLTSSGGHRSGRYASYWNAFLFIFSATNDVNCFWTHEKGRRSIEISERKLHSPNVTYNRLLLFLSCSESVDVEVGFTVWISCICGPVINSKACLISEHLDIISIKNFRCAMKYFILCLVNALNLFLVVCK